MINTKMNKWGQVVIIVLATVTIIAILQIIFQVYHLERGMICHARVTQNSVQGGRAGLISTVSLSWDGLLLIYTGWSFLTLVAMYKPQNFINEQHTERNKEEDLRAWQGLLGRRKYPREWRWSVRKGQKNLWTGQWHGICIYKSGKLKSIHSYN